MRKNEGSIMKAKLVSGILLLSVISIIVFFNSYRGEKDYRILKNPQPVDINQNFGEKKEFKKQRKLWIEDMHRAAPGVDWRAMNRKTRDQKNIAKLSKRKRMLAKSQLNQQGGTEQYANGLLVASWIEKGSNNLSGRMHTTEVDFENNLIYAGSAGGNIWVCDLEGNNWHSINDFLQFENILMVRRIPYDGGYRLIVVSSVGVAYTDNDGLTWDFATGLIDFDGWRYINHGVMTNDDNNTIFLLVREGSELTTIYKSTDLGKTFSKIYIFDDIRGDYCHIWTSRYENTKVFLLKKDDILSFSNDAPLGPVGRVDVQFPTGSLQNAVITGDNDASHLYIAYNVNGESIFYRSTDGGRTWSEQGTIDQSIFTNRSFCCSLINPDLVFLGGLDAFRGEAGGTSWEPINSWGQYYEDPENKLHADIPEIIPFINSEGEEILYFSTDGGLYVSKDGGLTVKNISLEGLRISQYYSTYTYRKDDTELIYAGSQDQGFQRSTWETGGLVEFEQLISGDYGHLVSGDGGTSVWGNYPGFVLYFPDGTRTADSHWWDFAGFENHLWMPPMCEHPTDPRKAYVGAGTSTSGFHLWCLTYSNYSFEVDEGDFDFGSEISAIGYSPLETNYLYVLTSNGMFFTSSDGGDSWTKTSSFSGPVGHYFYGSSIVGSPTVEGRVYIAGSGYSNAPVYVSDDYGATFTPMSTGLPPTLVFDMDINPEGDLLFVATAVGPYAYVDSLNEWIDIVGVYAPDQTYWTVEYVPILKTARFGTYGRGIWDFKVESFTSVKNEKDVSQVPGDFHLSNYPNPFNPTTTIRYDIPEASNVTLTIYNMNGQIIERLIDQKQEPGSYSVNWNAGNVSTGAYICQIQADGFQQVKKMLLIK